MTVKITKPEINVREQLNELKKPTGLAGEAMLRAETPQEQQALIGLGRRNLLINGGFDVWQRNGTSVVDSADGPYNYITADRWVTYYKGTYAQIEDTLPTGKIVKTMRYTVGSSGNAPNFNQPVENGGKIMAGQTVTMSWWMKASKSANIQSRLPNTASGVFAGGNSAYNLTVTPIGTHPVTAEWTYHTETKTFPSTMSHTNVHFELWGDNAEWSASDTFQMANCQLEFGKVATPFEHRSYGEELALCQRYYEQLGFAAAYQAFGIGAGKNTTTAQVSLPYRVQKRVAPTVTFVGTIGKIGLYDSSFRAATGISFYVGNAEGSNSVNATITSTSLASGKAYYFYLDSSLSTGITFDAEL
jgi:hypothetical protein